jgi:hypothetical protein
MLSVVIHKDVGDYQPKVFGKLTTRTLLSIAGAVVAAVVSACYFQFVLGVSIFAVQYIIYAVSLPFWLVGFFRPKGMTFERFFPLWLSHQLTNNRITYISSNYLCETAVPEQGTKMNKDYIKLTKLKGVEAWQPGAAEF